MKGYKACGKGLMALIIASRFWDKIVFWVVVSAVMCSGLVITA